MLSEVRLRALQESPTAFASTFEAEAGRSASAWETDAARRAQGTDEATFLAVGDGQCVGLVSAGRSGERPGVELFSMWVAPETRRRRIAVHLVRAVINWADAYGHETVWLWVARGNEPAIRLYQRMGFVTTGSHKPLPSVSEKELTLMVRPLGRRGDG